MHLPTVIYCALHIPWTFQTKHVPRLSPSFSSDTATWVYHLIFNDSSVYWGTLVWDLEPDIPRHSPRLCLLTDLPSVRSLVLALYPLVSSAALTQALAAACLFVSLPPDFYLFSLACTQPPGKVLMHRFSYSLVQIPFNDSLPSIVCIPGFLIWLTWPFMPSCSNSKIYALATKLPIISLLWTMPFFKFMLFFRLLLLPPSSVAWKCLHILYRD